ncbi:antitoxin Xre/MbcA/ParS toxin-binding domain-containing protein [Roseomonas sp. WA12]
MIPPLAGRATDVLSPAPHARLLGLCARVAAVQRRTEALAAQERRAERRGDLAAAERLHHRQVRLVHRRHRLLEAVCDLPAPTALKRQVKAAALATLITFDTDGRPDRLNGMALWSVLRDLEAAGSEFAASGEVLPPALLSALLRRVWRAGDGWALDNDAIRHLLGNPDDETAQAWFRHEAIPLPSGTRRRIGLLLALDHALRRLFRSAERRLDWMTRAHPGLGGRAPITRLLDGGLGGLLAVLALLAGEHRAAGAGDGRRTSSFPIEAALRQALTRFCDGTEVPPPAIAFPSWDALLRWVWDGDGDEDTAVRGRVAELLVRTERVIHNTDARRQWLTARTPWLGHLTPLAAATTPGGLHRALGLLRDVDALRRRLRDAGFPPADGDS